MNVKFILNKILLDKKTKAFGLKALTMLKSEVARGSDPYVPFDSGTLAKSVQPSVNTPDTKLIYNTLYAKKQYYGYPHKRTVFHPQASMQWFEKWKGAKGKATVAKIKAVAKGSFPKK